MSLAINYWAVLVAGIASMVIGGAWYSPFLFGRTWAALMNLPMGVPSPEMKKKMRQGYTINFIAALVTAAVMASLLNLLAISSVMEGLKIGFWLWLGFVAPLMVGTILWEGKPVKLYFINVSYQFVNFLITAAIIGGWQ